MKLLVVLVFVSGVFGEACNSVDWVDDDANDCVIACTDNQLVYKGENQPCGKDIGTADEGHCMGSAVTHPERCEPPATACPRISATEHAEAPSFIDGEFVNAGIFGLEFRVNCVFTDDAALVQDGTNLWTVKGGSQVPGMVWGASGSHHYSVTFVDDWGGVATFANDNALFRQETGFTEYYVVTEFKGTTQHLWDYSIGQKNGFRRARG